MLVSSLFDFTKYLLPGFAFPLEAKTILPQSVGTSWTVSRAEMETPWITYALLVSGSLAFFALLLFCALTWRLAKCFGPGAIDSFAIVLTCAARNAAMFPLEAGCMRMSVCAAGLYDILSGPVRVRVRRCGNDSPAQGRATGAHCVRLTEYNSRFLVKGG
ncbi:hypothetical protein [Caballeronia sp. GAFFF3]|uniref:hypothetical protein n=1 Tax=Caballeronia sp. GAFFF3 TaxID=2921759 RepID=UPI002027F85A|nr:hypothetical protein [Caballeronia sp. GAFFF3]